MENKKSLSRKKSLKKIFDKYILMEQYGDFKEIMDEILYRRAITFGFSNQRMKQECQKLRQNLKAISFYKGTSNNIMAYYSEDDQNIHINENYIKSLKESIDKQGEENYEIKIFEKALLGLNLFQIFSHELYHAIAPKQITEERIWKENIVFNRTAINEVVTESASNLTTALADAELDTNGYITTLGYPILTFSGALLSCALGVSERELYKHGLNNREEWDGFLKTKIVNGKNNESYTNFEDLLDGYLDTTRRKIAVDKIGLIERNSFKYNGYF